MLGKEVFKNIHYHTQLLESLGWDESQLTALLEYIDAEFNADIIKRPEDIAKNIEEFFGYQAAHCFTKIVNEVMFSCNLHTASTQYEN